MDEADIQRYLRELHKTYCSLDPINVSKIMKAYETAAPFLMSIINRFFAKGNFVDSEKVALLRPVLKRLALMLRI